MTSTSAPRPVGVDSRTRSMRPSRTSTPEALGTNPPGVPRRALTNAAKRLMRPELLRPLPRVPELGDGRRGPIAVQRVANGVVAFGPVEKIVRRVFAQQRIDARVRARARRPVVVGQRDRLLLIDALVAEKRMV